VAPPLNDFQKGCLRRFVEEVLKEGVRHTSNQMAVRICDLWNKEHVSLCGYGTPLGLGGILEYSTASAYLKQMDNTAYAITSNDPGSMLPEQQQPASPGNTASLPTGMSEPNY